MEDANVNYGTHLQTGITEAEIEKIVDKVVDKLEKKLYLSAGKGLLGVIWKILVTLGIAMAGYGAGTHWFK